MISKNCLREKSKECNPETWHNELMSIYEDGKSYNNFYKKQGD